MSNYLLYGIGGCIFSADESLRMAVVRFHEYVEKLPTSNLGVVASRSGQLEITSLQGDFEADEGHAFLYQGS